MRLVPLDGQSQFTLRILSKWQLSLLPYQIPLGRLATPFSPELPRMISRHHLNAGSKWSLKLTGRMRHCCHSVTHRNWPPSVSRLLRSSRSPKSWTSQNCPFASWMQNAGKLRLRLSPAFAPSSSYQTCLLPSHPALSATSALGLKLWSQVSFFTQPPFL